MIMRKELLNLMESIKMAKDGKGKNITKMEIYNLKENIKMI